jgi:hypothetical protein
MATTEWQLGDTPPRGYKLVREKHEVNTANREALLGKLSEVLGKAALRVTIEPRKPIEIVRLVKETEASDVPLFELDDVYGMVRNKEIKEISFVSSATVVVRLMDLFSHIHTAGYAPMAALVGDERRLREWLDYASPGPLHLMGVPVTVQPDLPDDVLIIACHIDVEDATEVDVSFKITLDPPEVRQ